MRLEVSSPARATVVTVGSTIEVDGFPMVVVQITATADEIDLAGRPPDRSSGKMSHHRVSPDTLVKRLPPDHVAARIVQHLVQPHPADLDNPWTQAFTLDGEVVAQKTIVGWEVCIVGPTQADPDVVDIDAIEDDSEEQS